MSSSKATYAVGFLLLGLVVGVVAGVFVPELHQAYITQTNTVLSGTTLSQTATVHTTETMLEYATATKTKTEVTALTRTETAMVTSTQYQTQTQILIQTQTIATTNTISTTGAAITQTTVVTSPCLSLVVSVSVARNPISRGSVQTIYVTVTDGTNKMSDATTTGRVTYASGYTHDFSGSTDANGQYSHSWQIGGNSNPGTFSVSVTATKAGYQDGHGSTAFTVTTA